MMVDNPDAFTPAVMQALQDIGLVVQDGDTYALKGENEDAQRSNFIRHLVPYFETMHLREETVLKIARGIGHWEKTDDLNMNSSRLWSAINHLTTTMTLGLGTAIQNLGEIPLLASVSGSKDLSAGLQRLASDEEFRRMLPQLGAALNKARDYLADNNTQAKYLSISLFTPTERWSRMVGVAVGWTTAKNAIDAYLQNPSKNARYRLEELNISVATIDNYRSVLQAEPGHAPAFEDLVKEAESRVLEGAMLIGGLRRPNAEPPSNSHVDWVGDEMAKAARYMYL